MFSLSRSTPRAATVVMTVLAVLASTFAWTVVAAPDASALGALGHQKRIEGGATTVGTNGTLTYELEVACSSNTDNCGVVTLTDVLPTGLTYVSANPGTSGWSSSHNGSGTVSFTSDGIMQDGDSVVVFITVQVDADYDPTDGPITNTSTVIGDNGTPSQPSNPVSVTVTQDPLWETRKSLPVLGVTPPALDTNVDYRVQLCGPSQGNVELPEFQLVDTFPAGATIVDADGGTVDNGASTITWTLPPVSQTDLAAVAPGDYCYTFNTVLNFPTGTFSDGDPISNTVVATPTNGVLDPDDYCDDCDTTVTTSVVEPIEIIGMSKTGDSTVSANGVASYNIYMESDGSNVPITDPTMIDIVPAELRVRGLNWNDSQQGAEISITTNGGGAWTTLADRAPGASSATYTQSDFDSAIGGSDNDVNGVRFVLYEIVSGLKVYQLSPFEDADANVFTETAKDGDAPSVGDDIVNCVDGTGSGLTEQNCQTTTVTVDEAVFGVDKSVSPTTVNPGETQTVELEMQTNSNNGLVIEDPVLYDLLPAGFTYSGYVGTTANSEIGPVPEPNVEIIDDYSGTGRQLVRFSWSATPPVGSTAPDGSAAVANAYDIEWTLAEMNAEENYWDKRVTVEFETFVEYGTAAATYANVGGGGTPTTKAPFCRNGGSHASDANDYAGSTVSFVCEESVNTTVPPSASLAGFKYDDGFPGLPHVDVLGGDISDCPQLASDPDYTRYPCYAQTYQGQAYPYTIEVFNEGNVPLENYWVYDILPHIGDVGVNEALYNSPRNSEFDVVLAGPITLGALPGGNSTAVIEYSDSYDPCRDEVANPGTATPWPSGCVDDWTTSPDNWGDVKAFRVFIPFDVTALQGAESFTIDVEALVPADAEFGEIAWNSIAHIADNTATATSLLPAAPRIAGISVPDPGALDPSSLPYDQALIKTLSDTNPDLANGAQPGDVVRFDLLVVNQGRQIEAIELTDYIDADQWEPFDISQNPSGSVTENGDGDTFSYSWSGDGTLAPTVRLTADAGDLTLGESFVVPVYLEIAAAWAGEEALVNWAEISNFDDDTTPGNDAADLTLTDADSTPDTTQSNDNQPTGPGGIGDDYVGGDGVGSDPYLDDEDDHDVAGLPFWDLSLIKELGSGQSYELDTSTIPPTATWSVTVKNQGPETAYFIDVHDTLPTGMSFTSFDGVTVGSAAVSLSSSDATTAQFRIDALDPSEAVTFELTTTVSDITQGEYINTAEISGFDGDSNPSNAPIPYIGDIDSFPDTDPSDDILDSDGDPDTNTVDPNDNDDRNSHNDIDYDHDNDLNVNEASPGDEDDHDQEVVVLPFDQALTKTLNATSGAPLTPGTSTVTFDINIINQGRDIKQISMVDYIDTDLFEVFDAAINTAGSVTDSGDGDTFNYTWTGDGTATPVVTLEAADTSASGQLDYGEILTVPITLTLDADWDGTSFENWAEISNFDDDHSSANGDAVTPDGNGDRLLDVDSTPDTTQANDNQPTGPNAAGDNEVGGDGVGSDPVTDDEDDHDVAGLPIYDLALIKTLGSGQGFVVDYSTSPPTVTWSITVKNQGDQTAYLIDVSDHIPTGMEFASLGAVTGSAAVTTTATAGDTGTIVFDIDDLIAGETVAFEVTMNVTDVTLAEFLNIAEISDFDSDSDAGNADDPFAVDIDSQPDAIPGNDAIDDDANSDPNGNDDRNSNNEIDYDTDGDGNVNEPNTGDEDDHDQEVVITPFDLALRKTFNDAALPLLPGTSTVTFDIELTNQGRPVQTVDVVDYIDSDFFEAFDVADNADSTVTDSGDGDVFDLTWTGDGTNAPVATLTAQNTGTGFFELNETLTLQIVLTIVGDWDGTNVVNWAEISNFDDDTNPANGDAVTPDGSGDLLTDIDSTPDTTQPNDNQPTGPNAAGDDEIGGDGTGSDPVTDDEDDHDVAGLPVWDLALIKQLGATQTYVVDADGSLVVEWSITVKNQGTEDAFLIEVTDDIPAGMEFTALGAPTAGTALVTTGAGAGATGSITLDIDALDAGESVTFPVTMTITDVALGEYRNVAEISAFDDDNDSGNAANPLAVDVDSTPDTDLSGDPILDDTGTDPNGNDDRNSHNEIDFDADGDGNVNEVELDGSLAVIDEDDHDAEVLVIGYDLALTKVVDVPATALPIALGGEVTFEIEITNQGRDVENFSVVDYIDTDAWRPFDITANPNGTTGGDAALSFTWDDADRTMPVVSIDGVLAYGDSVTIPVTLTVSDDANPATNRLDNWAEISEFDDDGNPLTAAPSDEDSTPDTTQTNDNQPTGPGADGDDEIDGDGTGSDPITDDEDDHDVAGVEIFDLALHKALNVSTSLPVVFGADVTFDITVINQGSVHATDPTVIDYVDLTMWEAFDAGDNPDGVTTGSAALPYTWSEAGTDGSVALTGTLAPGESVVIPVTLTITGAADLDRLINWAEISGGAPTESDGVTPVTQPDGSPLVDLDSVPDTEIDNDNQPENPGDPTDDVTDNTEDANGDPDEDDHDLATVTPPTYSLGNQVWFDLDDNGTIDPGEAGVDGVTVELYVDADRDGQPDDVNNDGLINAADRVATTQTASIDLDASGSVDETEQGLYLFEDLDAGDYVVVLPHAGNFDADSPLENWWSSTPTSTDPDDGTDSDDNGIDNGVAAGGSVSSGAVTVGPTSPVVEPGPDNDTVRPDAHENLTVDFGFTQYSLGNQVWIDTDNDGVIDPSEMPIAGVPMQLFTDNDADGLPDDTNGDGEISAADAIATTVTDTEGLYLFDGLAPGDYVVGIPPNAFDVDAALYGYLSSDPTSTNPDDDNDNDDNGMVGTVTNYVISGPVTLGDGEPLGEDPDNDEITPDANENLTVDFGFWRPNADLALRKQLDDGTNSRTVRIGDTIDFVITVFNQGEVTATNIEIIDYLPAGLELRDSDWALRQDGSAIYRIAGPLAEGEQVDVPITVRVIGDELDNEAEISAFTAVSSTGTVLTMPNGEPLPDVDSFADDDNTETPVEDEIANANADEDDHDGARLNLAPLAFTGAAGIRDLTAMALLLMAVGIFLVRGGRRRTVTPVRVPSS